MGLLRSKRGNLADLQLKPLFALVILFLFVFLPLMKFAYDIYSSKYFERSFIERDVAMTLDAIAASPNDLSVRYSNKYLNYLTVFVKKDSVQTFSIYPPPAESYKDSDDTTDVATKQLVTSYPFTNTKNQNIATARVTPDGDFTNPAKPIYKDPYELGFMRSVGGTTITIKTVPGSIVALPTNANLCPIENTAYPDWKKEQQTFIDISDEYLKSDKTYPATTDNVQSKLILDSICLNVISNKEGIYDSRGNVKSSPTGPYSSCYAGTKDTITNIKSFIGLDFYTDSDEGNDYFILYYDLKNIKSKKLACLIKNKLSSKTVLELDISTYPGKIDPSTIISDAMIIFSMGNIKNAESDTYDSRTYSNLIYRSLEEYYGTSP